MKNLILKRTIRRKLRNLDDYEKIPFSTEELLKLSIVCPEVGFGEVIEEEDSRICIRNNDSLLRIARLKNLIGEDYILIQHETVRGTYKWEKYIEVQEVTE